MITKKSWTLAKTAVFISLKRTAFLIKQSSFIFDWQKDAPLYGGNYVRFRHNGFCVSSSNVTFCN
ncbi:hypothetical protein HMPREF9554_01508 [Treponema phagedenis F0421]|nr:hypothetical protein HMPREF9554_01508 [Treponema phagedenis F0421]